MRTSLQETLQKTGVMVIDGSMSTALEQRWRDETLRALDETVDALGEVESSDFATLENIL